MTIFTDIKADLQVYKVKNFKNLEKILASLAQWIKSQPVDQRVPDSITVKGMCLVAGSSLAQGPAWG